MTCLEYGFLDSSDKEKDQRTSVAGDMNYGNLFQEEIYL